jgi:hypothetical protein
MHGQACELSNPLLLAEELSRSESLSPDCNPVDDEL